MRLGIIIRNISEKVESECKVLLLQVILQEMAYIAEDKKSKNTMNLHGVSIGIDLPMLMR